MKSSDHTNSEMDTYVQSEQLELHYWKDDDDKEDCIEYYPLRQAELVKKEANRLAENGYHVTVTCIKTVKHHTHLYQRYGKNTYEDVADRLQKFIEKEIGAMGNESNKSGTYNEAQEPDVVSIDANFYPSQTYGMPAENEKE